MDPKKVTYCCQCCGLTSSTRCNAAIVLKSGFKMVNGKDYNVSFCKEVKV